MPDIVNPYVPGKAVEGSGLFFGRRDLLASIREHLLKGRRVFLVAGGRRSGKTSLLRQLPASLPEGFLPVQVGLLEEPTKRLDWLVWRIADAVGIQVSLQVGVTGLEPAWSDFEGHPEYLLERFWPEVRAALGDRCLVLVLDDLECLAGQDDRLLTPFVEILAEWREQAECMALVLATSALLQERLMHEQPGLVGGAQTYILGPLSSEEAARLITWPVDGVLTYDYGVPRRLIEVTSGQPYYLQLVCYELFNRCAAGGWVNQRDVDIVLEDLVSREIADFRLFWDESSPPEQVVLAALASLRGARGVATVQEVGTMLTRAHARVKRDQIAEALERLAARGILERLGASSYRFRVALLRDWLARRLDLLAVVRDTRWSAGERLQRGGKRSEKPLRARSAPTRPQRKREPEPPSAEVTGGAGEHRSRFPWRWLALGAIVLLLAAVSTVGAMLWTPQPGQTLTAMAAFQKTQPLPATTAPGKSSATATPLAASQTPAQPTRSRTPTLSPTATSTPEPTATSTPSPPVVLTRPLLSIAYQSRERGEKAWSINLMTSDGTHRRQLAEGQAGFLAAPSWSPDGEKLAFVSDRDGAVDIWVMDLETGETVNLTNDEAQDHSPAWSPDGLWIAFASVRDSPYWELYMMHPDGSDVQRLTWWEDASDLSPSWSPDGTRLAFASKRDGNWEIYLMDRDGSNLIRLTDDPADDTNPAWSPDGSRIAFESTRAGFTDLFVLPVGGGEAVNVTNLPWATDLGPTWSPDGGRIAFYSDREGNWDVFVMASDGTNVVRLTGDGTNDQVPAWRP